jgi:hypothetical protein
VPDREAAAALCPTDHGEERQPPLLEPRPLLASGELQVGLGPLARPEVLLAVEGRGAQPVLAGELERVLDAHAALLGGVDEEQATERPERLAAEIGRGFLLEDDHALAGVDEFARGHETGEACTDHDDVEVGLFAHSCLLRHASAQYAVRLGPDEPHQVRPEPALH